LDVAADGTARLEGRVRAQKGTASGAPFSITPTIIE
jgi:hypothetical protein